MRGCDPDSSLGACGCTPKHAVSPGLPDSARQSSMAEGDGGHAALAMGTALGLGERLRQPSSIMVGSRLKRIGTHRRGTMLVQDVRGPESWQAVEGLRR